MSDFLLELACEEIPARMQARAAEQLASRFADGLKGQIPVEKIEVFVTPRRLALMATGLPEHGAAVSEERRGPRADAPEQALKGFLRSTGLTRDQLEERDTPKGKFLYAHLHSEGRPTAEVLAELIPTIIGGFDWPKSMRWGAASAVSHSPRWVRPLTSIIALFGDAVVPFEVAGITSGRSTRGHRFMRHGSIEIARPSEYAAKLRAANVILDPAERREIILNRARALAAENRLSLIEDDGLLHENAGLTEWPVPLLGNFDPAFLDVPPQVIQLTMRTNQKYFACTDAGGKLAPVFIAVANIAANDGGAVIAAGNARVLSARLSDAKFFWDADVAKVREHGLKAFTPKLADIVFHEKLGTLADKVDRVAKLARWLIESGAIPPSPRRGEGDSAKLSGERGLPAATNAAAAVEAAPLSPLASGESPSPQRGEGAEALADMAERAARLCKADLTTATVGEFPELQGLIGGYLALIPSPRRGEGDSAQLSGERGSAPQTPPPSHSREGGNPDAADSMDSRLRGNDDARAEALAPLPQAVADAIRDHYKPVGQGDDVPTAPVSVAVALADKLDTLIVFFFEGVRPTGSSDPYALRRAALTILSIVLENNLRIELAQASYAILANYVGKKFGRIAADDFERIEAAMDTLNLPLKPGARDRLLKDLADQATREATVQKIFVEPAERTGAALLAFLADRLKVQQREAGVRHDLIDAVFALGGEDDLVRLLARVHALQAFLATADGSNLLAGAKRAANILRIEEAKDGAKTGAVDTALLTEPAEQALAAALATTLPIVEAALLAEDFAGAMTALAALRAPVDGFFEVVKVNADEPALRTNRLNLLNQLRSSVQTVADFTKIEG